MKFSLIFLNFVALMALVACAGNLQKNHKPVTLVAKGKSNELVALADQAANLYGVNRRLFRALVKQESAWDPYALSPKGARGLTQIMPRTGKAECGLEKEMLFNPRLNLYCGAYYFSKLLRRFGNVELALAAYNSGETRVARLGRIPRIRETQRYVKRIMASWQSSHFIRRW